MESSALMKETAANECSGIGNGATEIMLKNDSARNDPSSPRVATAVNSSHAAVVIVGETTRVTTRIKQQQQQEGCVEEKKEESSQTFTTLMIQAAEEEAASRRKVQGDGQDKAHISRIKEESGSLGSMARKRQEIPSYEIG